MPKSLPAPVHDAGKDAKAKQEEEDRKLAVKLQQQLDLQDKHTPAVKVG